MSFQISKDKIGNPLLIELLKKLVDCFEKAELTFYVIGATARDIIMQQLVDVSSQRRTRDLDIAIAIPNWNKFEDISQIMVSEGFKKSKKSNQRFFFGDYELDIVPYGNIAKEDDNIYWPPEEDIAMSVKGFNEVLQDAITVNIDKEVTFKVASLHGLFLLKFNAWQDRKDRTDKDAEDMSFILENYYEANLDRVIGNDIYNKVLDRDDFDPYIAGGNWIAFDLLPLLNDEQLKYYSNCILDEIESREASILINKTLEHNRCLKFEKVLQTWQEIANILKDEFESRQSDENRNH